MMSGDMAVIIDGKTLAQRIREKVKIRIAALATPPGLAVLLVGDDPASHTYVGLKRKACEEVDIHFEQHLYGEQTTEETLIQKISELNVRTDIHGILVQLPLPAHNADRIIAAIDPRKDVDGFHPVNMEKLRRGEPAIAPAVALGILKLIAEVRGLLPNPASAAIISSPLFAEPLIILLKEQHIDSTVVELTDPSLKQKTRQADLLIVAIGSPGLITGEFVKPGAVVIDVGTTRTQDGLKGDVDFDSVSPVAGALTPVPGGVGPMTVAMLLLNTLKAYDLNRLSK